MGDKYNGIFSKLGLFAGASEEDLKPLKIVEALFGYNPEDAAELDRLSVREKIQFEPLNIEPISFECEMPIGDIAPIFGIDLASEPSKQVCTLVIQDKPTINKPRNLKYPNKKRAKRIWNNWAKRYGTTPGKCLYLPNVEVGCKLSNEQEGF